MNVGEEIRDGVSLLASDIIGVTQCQFRDTDPIAGYATKSLPTLDTVSNGLIGVLYRLTALASAVLEMKKPGDIEV